MYIHLGQEKVINSKDVIGIFDIENTTISKNTRIFLNKAEKKAQVVNVSYELPKSLQFVLIKIIIKQFIYHKFPLLRLISVQHTKINTNKV